MKFKTWEEATALYAVAGRMGVFPTHAREQIAQEAYRLDIDVEEVKTRQQWLVEGRSVKLTELQRGIAVTEHSDSFVFLDENNERIVAHAPIEGAELIGVTSDLSRGATSVFYDISQTTQRAQRDRAELLVHDELVVDALKRYSKMFGAKVELRGSTGEISFDRKVILLDHRLSPRDQAIELAVSTGAFLMPHAERYEHELFALATLEGLGMRVREQMLERLYESAGEPAAEASPMILTMSGIVNESITPGYVKGRPAPVASVEHVAIQRHIEVQKGGLQL